MSVKVFRASTLLVEPVALRHASRLAIGRNYRCCHTDCAPIRCQHRKGFHVFILGLVVIVG